MFPIEQFIRPGFISIDYPAPLRRAVVHAAASWKRFCQLPKKLKTLFFAGENGFDVAGYELKQSPGFNKDLKENFEFTSGSYDWLMQVARQTGNRAAQTFVRNAQKVAAHIEPLVLRLALALEQYFELPGIYGEIRDGRQSWFVRFLHYFGGHHKPGEEIAAPHPDKSGVTFHLHEDDSGLQYLSLPSPSVWREMPVSAGKTVIMPNMQLQYRCPDLKALCHRVVATPQSAKAGRYSMVCFVPFLNTPKAKVRLQEFRPGFNYRMSRKKFLALF